MDVVVYKNIFQKILKDSPDFSAVNSKIQLRIMNLTGLCYTLWCLIKHSWKVFNWY